MQVVRLEGSKVVCVWSCVGQQRPHYSHNSMYLVTEYMDAGGLQLARPFWILSDGLVRRKRLESLSIVALGLIV